MPSIFCTLHTNPVTAKAESAAILSKMFVPVTRAEVFKWKNSHPGFRDLGRKNRDLGNRTSPTSHMNTPTFYEGISGEATLKEIGGWAV